MRVLLLTIQVIIIAGVFVESWIVFRSWKNTLHGYLFISCIALLVNNLGYMMEMLSKTQASYLTALKLSYAGRVYFALFLFFFITEMCRIHIPGFLKSILILFHVGIYISVLMIEQNRLYYDGLKFATGNTFPVLSHGNGPVHKIFFFTQMIYALLGMFFLYRRLWREKNKTTRKCLLMVIIAVTTEAVFLVIQTIGIDRLTDIYDVTMIGYVLGTIFTMIAILRFDLLGTSEIAREYLIERLSEGIIAADREGVVRYYNAPVKTLYPEIDETPDAVLEEVAKAVRSGENLLKNGRVFKPEKNTLRDGREKVGTLYVLVDETEHIRYMTELEEQKAIADRANKAKSTFLANMSHEIRTPINAVLGMDEMILRESREEDTRAYAADIMSAGKTLLSLINDILDLSKVEEGKMEIIPVEYDLATLVGDLVNMIRDRAEKKGLVFTVDVDEHIPQYLIGDEIRIRQCVLNLLTNAVKYTEKGSVTLRIMTEKKEEDRIVLRFSVRDTGIGIKKEDQEKLFASFERIEEKRNRNIEGTGLGMSITTQLLELMGSRLDFTSEYGCGSEFGFSLELEIVEPIEIGDVANRINERKQVVYRELFRAPDAAILVVDDTETNLAVIKNLLKRTEVQIDTAMSGKEALLLSEKKHYDLIFIDHMMPEMDGIETLHRMREQDKNTETPTVALTANAVSGAKQMYLDAGFSAYLSKPVDGKSLEKMIHWLLPDEKLLEPAEGEMPQETATLPEWLLAVSRLDTGEGVRNGGGVEGYLSILDVFYRTAGANADEIGELFEQENITDYTIKVHALKSSARIVGATGLSELAKQLEDAGKEGDTAFIREHTPELLAQYRELEKELSPLGTADGSAKPISDTALKEAYQTIIEISSAMDFDLMDELMKELQQYRLPEEDDLRIKTIQKLCLAMDWEGIRREAEQGMGKEG